LIAPCGLRTGATLSGYGGDFGQPVHLQVSFCAPLSRCDVT
jgi:hypothetical protein